MFPLKFNLCLHLELSLVAALVFFNLSANAQHHRQYYYHDGLLANSLSINGNFNYSIYEQNSSFNYAKGASIELEIPFSKENHGFDRLVSGYAKVDIMAREYSDEGDPGGPAFYQGNAGLRVGNFFWNDDGSVAVRPQVSLGVNYRSKCDVFSPGDNLAFKVGTGIDIVLSGQNLNSGFFQKFDLMFFNCISTDTRFGKTNRGKYTLSTECESGVKLVYKW